MKRQICLLMALAMLTAGCQAVPAETTIPLESTVPQTQANTDTVAIALDEDTVYVEDGAGVYTANDIIYYEAGHDFTYGEGESGDEHEAAEALAHTVVHITRPGTYRISGKLSAGQIAVDLGDGAEEDPNAVVTLILDGVDITCTVAPAIMFYNVYECGSTDTETAGPVVDTSAAGANVIIADGSENIVNGSYVARIYKEGTVELNEDGTEVADAKKLHKYDAAFYSKMSMNVSGGGKLTINAENEGLDSELHLTINGGEILINSGNDGINTNEDGVSVTTVNGGSVTINVTGQTGEGDGIDSNGWLVINGGSVTAFACGFSGDAGIDSDMGIYLNGGAVIAAGNMLDRIAGGDATYAVFQFAEPQTGGGVYALKNEAGDIVMECSPVNDFSYLILSGEGLVPGTYSFWKGQTQLAAASGSMGGQGAPGNFGAPGNVPGGFNGEKPEGDYQIPGQPGMQMQPQGGTPGQGMEPQDGQAPQMPGQFDGEKPEGDFQIPEQPGQGGERPEGDTRPEGEMPEGPGQWPQGGGMWQMGESSTEFVINAGENQFVMVGPAE